MATESDLRHRFRDPDAPAGTVDVEAVIRRARARRRPRAIAAAGASTLAAVAIVVPLTLVGIGSLTPTEPDATLAGGAADSALGTDEVQERAPVSRINLCEGTIAEAAPFDSGLALALPTTAVEAGGDPVMIDVTLINTSDAEIRGTVLGEPALTLSDEGIVVWHSNGPSTATGEARPFALEPGESATFAARLDLVQCSIEDDEGEEFRPDLPALPGGDYALTALLEIDLGDGAGPILVGAPATAIRVE
ncbi:hypothetical protein [uncultured Schumannella sp.]|uniref:hypothetical protein n=1 Tax=uncultured Schumannella sp. TaxID=1195956 RepID=UPI0025DA9313|nr:hypothetical protein [uncultured Schumannella sp.]